MFGSSTLRRNRYRSLPALRIAFIYSVVAALWIVFSDRALALLEVDSRTLSLLQTWKGLFYVLVTALMVFVLVRHDLRKQNQLIDALTDNRQRLDLILNTLPGGILENDLAGRIVYANSGLHRLLGYLPGELAGRLVWEFAAGPEDERQLRDYVFYNARYQPEPQSYLCRCLSRDGRVLALQVNWDYQRDAAGNVIGFTSAISDISAQQEQRQKIHQLAYYDSLTGLPNRVQSMESLSTMLERARGRQSRVAVILLDIDYFQHINDTLGHTAGDALLIAVAGRLHDGLYPGEVLGRLGGDEFIILSADGDETVDLPARLAWLQQQFDTAFKIDGHSFSLAASVGVALFPQHGENATELLRNADSALNVAKARGRNTQVYYAETMNQDVSRRFNLEMSLRTALARDEFRLLYQPLVTLADERIVGAEALLRWHSADLGEVMPDEFIPVAEQSDVIVPLGRHVMEQALTLASTVCRQGRADFTMAINLSPRQFRDQDLPAFLEDCMKRLGIDRGQIELEITEGVLMSQGERVRERLEHFSRLGIKLSMDDFGTGYSSLSYLRNFPFDVLKIDRQFIDDIESKESGRALIRAAIAMSRALGVRVVAEGVETAEQVRFLKDLGCDYAQGYYFGKPMSESALLGRLAEAGDA